METIYIVILTILIGLSITGLVVGVSNDAVNFLSSAFGSKVASLRTIFTVASIGVLIGATFSSGMMEIPRSGIFYPSMFHFNEVMIIFLAVILANILLLDFFNSLGLPTSTSVSIVFELLGAAAVLAFLKIYYHQPGSTEVLDYLNTSKVMQIVVGILLSVLIAFNLGALIQYISRLVFTFEFERKLKYFGAIFGGVSLTALTYFLFINGLTSLSFVPENLKNFIDEEVLIVIGISLVVWTVVSQMIMSVFKKDILKIIILVGTFSLALAFAGNDLVNFIGVPLAAKDAFDLWHNAYLSLGTAPDEFLMHGLNEEASTTSMVYLWFAGVIMVLTLWFSKQARSVIETGVNLSRQDATGDEKFEPNNLSRVIVRYSIIMLNGVSIVMPRKLRERVEKKFKKPDSLLNDSRLDEPAFDKVRASVNLVVAAILISIGTTMKLPLSTTYVTFMVAMGTSLSDRAWDRESAVYRVAGVLNVIGGWFATAFIAFAGAAIFAVILWYGKMPAVILLSAIAVFVVTRSAILHSKKAKEEKKNKRFNREELITIKEITLEISDNISKVIKRINKRYGKVVDHLGYHDLNKLKKDKKKVEKIEEEVEELKDNVFYFIRSMEENTMEASKFYILFLDYLETMVESIEEIAEASYEHVNNNHKHLKFNQIRDLKKMGNEMTLMFNEIIETFDSRSFGNIDRIIRNKSFLADDVSELIQKQIRRIRTTESSRKNTKLYFGLLLETKDLINATMDLLHLFKDFYSEARDYQL